MTDDEFERRLADLLATLDDASTLLAKHGSRSPNTAGCNNSGERGSPDRIPQGDKTVFVEPGDRMFIWCEGGPSVGRAVPFPPPLEISVDGGVYVLVDDGPPEAWHYEFVTESDLAM